MVGFLRVSKALSKVLLVSFGGAGTISRSRSQQNYLTHVTYWPEFQHLNVARIRKSLDVTALEQRIARFIYAVVAAANGRCKAEEY